MIYQYVSPMHNKIYMDGQNQGLKKRGTMKNLKQMLSPNGSGSEQPQGQGEEKEGHSLHEESMLNTSLEDHGMLDGPEYRELTIHIY